MKKRLLLLLVALSCVRAFASGGNVVGNSGDGFLIGGKIHLRDLVEAKTHLVPWVGDDGDMGPAGRAATRALAKLEWNPETLLRKLSDLNRSFPGTGDALAAVIASYGWELTDSNDSLPAEPTTLTSAALENERVQIAIRLNGIVHVRRAAWELMAEADRAALVLHEATMSLLRPLCMGPGRCFQRQQYELYYIGLLFDRMTMEETRGLALKDSVLGRIGNSFNLPLAALESTLTVRTGPRETSFDPRGGVNAQAIAAVCARSRGEAELMLESSAARIRRKQYIQWKGKGAILDYRVVDADGDRRSTVSRLDLGRDAASCAAALRRRVGEIRADLLPADVDRIKTDY